MMLFCPYLSLSLTACLWYRTVRLTEVTRTAATLTSQPCIACPSGIFTRRPFSFAPRSTTSISENDIRSSYPDAVGIPDTIISSTSFSAFRASFLRLVSSKRSSEDDTCLLANDSRNCTRNEVSHTESPATRLQDWCNHIPPATYPAKTPSRGPDRGKGTCAHDAQRCIAESAAQNQRGQLPQIPI